MNGSYNPGTLAGKLTGTALTTRTLTAADERRVTPVSWVVNGSNERSDTVDAVHAFVQLGATLYETQQAFRQRRESVKQAADRHPDR
jgi:hypothetical protein